MRWTCPATAGGASIDDQLAGILSAAESGGGGGGGIAPTVDQIADRLLTNPANKLLTHSDGSVSIVSGTGNTAVDHNTGGTGNLRVEVMGNGVDGATVRAYLTSAYTTNASTALLLGSTTTGSDGRWLAPIYLTAGASYTIVAELAGVLAAQAKTITI